jgi:phage terminase Nu1 subunit (DNA packaging protein)
VSLVTATAYAALHGVSSVTVHKWKKKGRLVFSGKLIDVEASDAVLAQYRDPHDARADRGPPKASPELTIALKARLPPPPPPAYRPTGGEQMRQAVLDAADPDELSDALAAGRATTEEARRVKENYLALRGKLEYEQAAGSLVDMARAEAVLFEAARAVRNAWLGFPSKHGARIAADLGIDADRVTAVLTAYVHKQVAQLGEPDANFAG